MAGSTCIHIGFSEIGMPIVVGPSIGDVAVGSGGPIGKGMIRGEDTSTSMTRHAIDRKIMAGGAIFALAVERECMCIYKAFAVWNALEIVAAMAHIATLFLNVALRASGNIGACHFIVTLHPLQSVILRQQVVCIDVTEGAFRTYLSPVVTGHAGRHAG